MTMYGILIVHSNSDANIGRWRCAGAGAGTGTLYIGTQEEAEQIAIRLNIEWNGKAGFSARKFMRKDCKALRKDYRAKVQDYS